jgi:hypothetical protein
MGDKSAHLRRAPIPDPPPAGRLSIGERLPHFEVHLGQARHAESRRGSAFGRVLVEPSPLRSSKGAGMGQEPLPNELAPSKPVRPCHVPRKQFCRNINVFAALPHQQSRLGKQPSCLPLGGTTQRVRSARTSAAKLIRGLSVSASRSGSRASNLGATTAVGPVGNTMLGPPVRELPPSHPCARMPNSRSANALKRRRGGRRRWPSGERANRSAVLLRRPTYVKHVPIMVLFRRHWASCRRAESTRRR